MAQLTGTLWFLGKFLAVAGPLFWLWSARGLADWYAYAVLEVVRALAPLLTGYRFEITGVPLGVSGAFVAEATRAPLPFNLREVCAGFIPFLALMGASVTSPLRRHAERTLIGLGVLYSAHIGLVFLSPLLVTSHQTRLTRILVDVGSEFYVLAACVALPVLLWLVLVRPFDPPPARPPARSSRPTGS